MEKAKSGPSITITTYSASKSSYLRHAIEGQQHQQDLTVGHAEATRSDFSTNFFRNSSRPGGSQQNQTRTAPRNRVLSDLSQIKGPTGSVRGHKDVVRRSLEGIKVTYSSRGANFCSSPISSASLLNLSTFFAGQLASQEPRNQLQCSGRVGGSTKANISLLTIGNEQHLSEYLARLVEDEQNLCVAYTTTLGVIRRTFEDSKIMKSILNLNLVKFEERDIYLNQEYKFQLRVRTGGSIVVPALFVDGQYIGSVLELETMNENGELQIMMGKFKMAKATSEICSCCGNARFIACQSCNGSRKSTIHHFKFNSIALRCINCDKNDGLVRCPVCSSRELCAQQLELGEEGSELDEEDEEEEEAGAGSTKVDDRSAVKLACGQDENVDINNN